MKQINSDKHILETYSADREKGFYLLLVKYRESLYFHIRKILIVHDDTDDALQSTFLKIWDKLDTFREQSSLFTWIYRIATNEALAVLNKRKRDINYDPADLDNIFGASAEADRWFEGDEIQKKLLNAIRRLPEKQQLVFNLRYFEDLKYEEISEILSISVGSLKASYHHARKKIETFLAED